MVEKTAQAKAAQATPGAVVSVVWTDAWFILDADETDPVDHPVRTIGFVVESTGPFLVIAQERTPIGYRAITGIPYVLIQDFNYLERGDI